MILVNANKVEMGLVRLEDEIALNAFYRKFPDANLSETSRTNEQSQIPMLLKDNCETSMSI